MPPPTNPPYAAGALSIPRQLNRWLDINPVRPLGRTRGFFTLPTFSVAQPHGTGYANIIAAFNYTASRNFSIKSISSFSSIYVLCVMWVDQFRNVHRYALWPNIDQTFYFQLVPYTNQLIGKNFRLEVWNGDYIVQLHQERLETEDGDGLLGDGLGDFLVTEEQAYPPSESQASTIVQEVPITFFTSLLGEFDYMWADDFTIALASPVVMDFYFPLNNPLTPPIDSTPTPTTI